MGATTVAEEAAIGAGGPAHGGLVDTLVSDATHYPGALPETSPWAPGEPADPVICECLQVRLGTLEACIRRGCTTQEDLARETGATTVCGGCEFRVAEMVGRPSGTPAQILEVRELLPTVRSIRFAADPARAAPVVQPGQHVIVSALIDEAWVSRPYTLTSLPGHPIREITVRREPGGVLSSWLFERRPGESHPIRVTAPQGSFCMDLGRREPIVFLAAGIGVTPAIALARAYASRGGHLVHIDYSVREPDGFAFGEELRKLAAWCDGLSVKFRVSSRGERLTAEEVRELRWRFPRGSFYICGPASYQEAVQAHLAAACVEEDRIRVETFTPLRRPPEHPSAEPPAVVAKAKRRFPNARSQAVGLVLLLLYLAQGTFGWDWPWLQSLQTEEGYRRWSGAVLLCFIGFQWALPILRLRETSDFRAVKFAYRWHRWAGALSPVFFYAHASWLGYGYLFALAAVYLSNVGIGLWDKTIIQDIALRERYVRIWLVPHVALACLTVGLTLFHLWVVFAYQ
jgi:ferredoxin-NADP reductase